MWMGELITDRGVGNGMSVMIFTQVIAVFPTELSSVYQSKGAFALTVVILVGVAVIGLLAALIIMLANRSGRLRLLATGVLFGFGIQTALLFAGYEFYVRSPNRAGPGGAVGILGGVVFIAAALIAAASRPASSAGTSGSASG